MQMEVFSVNSAKSYIGKDVNLHLKDGSVIVNVHLTGIRKDDFGKGNLIEFKPFGYRKSNLIPLRSVAWAELLAVSWMYVAG